MLPRVDPFVAALLTAGITHAAILAALLGPLRSESEPASAASNTAVELFDIEPAPGEKIPAERPTSSDPIIDRFARGSSPPARSRGARIAIKHDDAPMRRPPSPHDAVESSAPSGSAPEGPRPPEPATDAASESPSFSLAQLGLEGPNRLSLTALREEQGSATGRGTSGRRVDGAMRQLAREHDRKVGLGAGGPVATALEKAAYASHATPNGQATFEVVVINDAVSTISLLPTGAEKDSAWKDVARAALAQLTGRRVPVPTGSRGVMLRIQVSSRTALPSGHDPGLEISVGPFVIQRGRGKRSARLAFLQPDPAHALALDLRGAASGGGMALVRTDIDPVDLGTADRQVVHAQTLDETPID